MSSVLHQQIIHREGRVPGQKQRKSQAQPKPKPPQIPDVSAQQAAQAHAAQQAAQAAAAQAAQHLRAAQHLHAVQQRQQHHMGEEEQDAAVEYISNDLSVQSGVLVGLRY